MRLADKNKFVTNVKDKVTALVTIKNTKGMHVQITNFGAKIVTIFVPDKHGVYADVVLGYDSIQDYIHGQPYFGAVCGRYANRIANGQFSIDGNGFQLATNNGPNALHGGPEGFHARVWDILSVSDDQITLQYESADGEEGYPGRLTVNVIYSVTDQNELKIEYSATSDKDTIINLTSHSFFNLAGEGNSDVLHHEILIHADTFTPVNEVQIPTGELRSVKGTPMDFTKSTVIAAGINADDDQIRYGKGYDHNWVLNKKPGEPGLAAVCYEPVSGRVMEVQTDQPGLQLYTGNWLDGSDKGKDGKVYGFRSALCLETQKFPDSPNKSEFPSALLKHGDIYKHLCIYKFSTKQ